MEYLALALFAVGILLVLGGFLLNQNDTRSGREASMARMARQYPPPTFSQPSAPAPPAPAPQAPLNQAHWPMASSPPQYQPSPPSSPAVSMPPQQEFAPAQRAPASQVEVVVQNTNPTLFEKSAYLYLDSSRQNSYTGEEAAFSLHDVVGIRRFGQGSFTYDGFDFRFRHRGGTEKFPLERLDHIAFYPNCVVLVPKNDLPSALLFVDETDTIRRVLETFKVEDAS